MDFSKAFDEVPRPEKIYRLKEDQAFSLSLELGRREKVLRHPSADLVPTQPQKEGVVRIL
jgi:hypothetical protein